MKNLVFDMSSMHRHGRAFYDFLKLRKRVLVDGLGWDVPNDGEAEMDQYDTPLAQYSVIESNGRIIAGARTLPASARWGNYTIMMRDATEGRIEGVPPAMLSQELYTPDVWECTRLVIADEVATHETRLLCLAMLVDGLVRRVLALGGTQMVSLSPLPLQRTLRALGYDVSRISEPYRDDGDGRLYAVLAMPAVRQLEKLTALGATVDRDDLVELFVAE